MRGPHVAEAYLALLIFIALIVHVLAPGSLGRTAKLAQQIPVLSDRLASGEIATDMGNKYGWKEAQTLRLKAFLVQHRSNIQDMAGGAERFARTAIPAMVVIPILAIFFLSDGETLVNQVIHLVATKDNYELLRSLAIELNAMLHHYIKAKVTLSGLSFAYASTWLLILRFPHAVTLGLLAGILEFIPIARWMTAAITIVSFGALAHTHWIWMAALLGIWRMLIDYWIAPRVLGHELEIHPLLAHIHFDGRGRCWRSRRSLSFLAICRCDQSCLAKTGFPSSPRDRRRTRFAPSGKTWFRRSRSRHSIRTFGLTPSAAARNVAARSRRKNKPV